MKKRILFVEDDPLQLQMYVMMMDDEREHWEVATAVDAAQALQLMERVPFDVIVSDLVMPRMDGAAFMAEVRIRCPGAARIILSVLSDQERVAHALEATHQFIAKPFDVRTLKTTLSCISGLDAYLKDDKLKGLVGRLGTLPSFPTLYLEITKELGSLDASIERIATIIARDPGMTAKMLQIVNSAAVGLVRKISSPFEAVQFLGMGTVRSLVLSAHIFARFEHTNLKGFSVNHLWEHGLKTGQVACRILQLERGDPADAEDAFIAGMLHDVGKLMLADCMPEPFQQALTLAAERNIKLHEAELEVFGATHAGTAAYLLGLWGLPAPMVEAVAFHHTPSQSDRRVIGPLAAVHAANVFEHELSRAKVPGRPAELDTQYLAGLKIGNRIEDWRAEAAKIAGRYSTGMGPENS